MKKWIIGFALGSCAAFVLAALAYGRYGAGALLSLAITFGTIAYHFVMRLLVGAAVNAVMHDRANYRARWYQPKPFEEGLYRVLKPWRWKRRLPTYAPERFSMERPLEEVAQTMCQSEIVHEIIVVLSLLPLLAVKRFGALPAFLITSVLAACLDAAFVVMQRYNRPRILKLMQRLQEREVRRKGE